MPMKKRRGILLAPVLSLALPAVPAHARQFPDRPVRLIVPYSAGGGTDTAARFLAKKLTEKWGQPVIVDNRPGAGGIIASDIVAKAAADGYTLLLSSSAHAVNQTLYRKLPYDTRRDFTPLAFLAIAPNIMVVNPKLPVHSVQEFIALAKSEPGKLDFGSGGAGSMPDLAGELFKRMAGIDMHHIPYKGGAPATMDLVAGRLSVMFGGMVITLPFVKSGQLRALATTGAQRSKMLPDLPTVAESGVPGYEAQDWFGVFAPGRLPAPLAETLNQTIRSVVRTPDSQKRFAELGAQTMDMSTREFAAFVDKEIDKWGKVVKAANAYAD